VNDPTRNIESVFDIYVGPDDRRDGVIIVIP